jgi:hypothetical protein
MISLVGLVIFIFVILLFCSKKSVRKSSTGTKSMYQCECGLIFTQKVYLKNHKESACKLAKDNIMYQCECGLIFTERKPFIKHKKLAKNCLLE